MTGTKLPPTAIWAIVARQHGVISRAQLLEAGLTRHAIEHRISRGRLHPVARGTYAVGRPEVTRHGRWMAAVLLAGPGAGLADESAAALWEIRPYRPGRIHVAVPHRARRHARGIVVHRRRHLELVRKDGIPLTSPTDTLIALATHLTLVELEAAVNEADKLDLIDPERLRRDIDKAPRQPGIGALRGLLDRHTFHLTDSELERRFLRIVRAAGLPEPVTGLVIDGYKTDFAWPELKLIVETDGLRYHRTASRQTADRVRDQVHTAAGRTVLRFSHAQITYDPGHVTRILRTTAARL